MKPLVFALALLVVGLSTAHASPPPPMPRPAVRLSSDSLFDMWERGDLEEAEEALLAALRAGGSKGLAPLFPAADSDLGSYFASVGGSDWTASLTGISPLADGLLARLYMEGKDKDGDKITVDYTVWTTREAGQWRFYSQIPDRVFRDTRVERRRADVWVSHRRRWLSIEVEVELQVDGPVARLITPALQLSSDEQGADLTPGLRLVEAAVFADGAWVQPNLLWRNNSLYARVVPGKTRLRVRFEGQPESMWLGTQLRDSEMQLHVWGLEEAWPTLHPTEVTVHVERGERVFASMPLAEASSRAGWTTWRGQQRRDSLPELVISPERDDDARQLVLDDGAGSRLTLLRAPAGCSEAMKPILAAMGGFLPVGSLRVLGIKPSSWLSGQQYDDLVLVQESLYATLCSAEPDAHTRAILAHELAHRWFGSEVRTVDNKASRWWESLAEYLAFALTPGSEGARGVRAADYARAAREIDWAMTADWRDDHSDELSYGRGMLLMTALEDRVGRPLVLAALRRFVQDNRGELGSWDKIIAAVAAEAGQGHADWLRTWLERPGAPDLHLDDPKRKGAHLSVTLHQSNGAPWSGAVELVFTGGGKRLAAQRVEFSQAETVLSLSIPEGADRLELDPDHRLPRLYDPDKDTVLTLRAVDLGGLGEASAVRAQRAKQLDELGKPKSR